MYKMIEIKNLKKSYDGEKNVINDLSLVIEDEITFGLIGNSGAGDSDIMMTDTINSFKSKFKGFHKTFKQDDLGLSLSSFLLN